jgi:hypothetical protein
MNQHQKQFTSTTVNTLGALMGKIKFDGSMSGREIEQMRGQLYDAKSSLSVIGDVSPLTPELELLNRTACLLEKALNTASDSHLI